MHVTAFGGCMNTASICTENSFCEKENKNTLAAEVHWVLCSTNCATPTPIRFFRNQTHSLCTMSSTCLLSSLEIKLTACAPVLNMPIKFFWNQTHSLCTSVLNSLQNPVHSQIALTGWRLANTHRFIGHACMNLWQANQHFTVLSMT